MKKINLKFRYGFVVLSLLVLATPAQPGRIVDTKHNLSTSGRGEIRSSTETRVCIFCHSSHNSSPDGPLWGHQTTTTGSFKTYRRATLKSQPQQPNGSTKLCLSCHDGTIAVGAIKGLSRAIPMQNVGASGAIPQLNKSNIGRDLSGTHPVSIPYKQATALSVSHLRWPPVDAEKKVGPDADGFVQCTACHDPHDNSRSDKYPFWNKSSFDEVCKTCHTY